MMSIRWLWVCACATVALALSPAPAPVEWAAFERTLRDPAYRLPATVRPTHYDLTITPYFDNVTAPQTPFTFDGEVTMYFTPTVSENSLVLHCNDMTILSVEINQFGGPDNLATPGQEYFCEYPYQFLRIQTIQNLWSGWEYSVRITFLGNIQNDMRGFYRSWYVDSSTRRWMGTTQFQPGNARSAFPCLDEPGYKATFNITIVREQDFRPTISNMPIRLTQQVGDRIAETFYQTPVTSTYLLAFIVSHYERVAPNNDTSRPFHIYARDNAGSTADWSRDIGERLLTAMEDYTQFPYYTMADSMDMKQAAIPDFSAGAMENWGLLTYREALILYDPENSNHFYRQRVANIVAHEIAHMWFGNLVTCAWWDNLWLNEGFARFYQYYLPQMVIPELGYDIRFVVEQVQTAMFSDSVDTAHALTNPEVNDPASVSAHFSTITYARGASVLRMTQHLLGNDTYVKGLRSYLQQRQFDVAEPEHLFGALDIAAAEDGALQQYPGVTVDSYLRTWSLQAGHPLLTVSVDQRTGDITVSQSRWERSTGVSSITSVWAVPLTWTRGGAPEFNDLKPAAVLSAQSAQLQRGSTGNEWVIFNKQQSGFYRVNYDRTNWALITRALRSAERTTIHELNRAQIVDDVFALGRAGVLPYDAALNVLSFLEFEDAYAPWYAAISGFNFLVRRLSHDAQEVARLQSEIVRLSAAVVSRLGFAEVSGEEYMTGLLRMYVGELLCDVGHPQCIAAAATNFQQWRNGAVVPPNMRPWVYCEGLRAGGADDFDFYWTRYLNVDLANDKIVMLQNAGCTGHEPSLRRFLDAIVTGDDDIRPQDYSAALSSAITRNEANTMRAFSWLRDNVNQTIATLGSISSPLNTIIGRLLNEQQIQEVDTWLDENEASIGSAYTSGKNAIATTRANLAWSARRGPEISAYLDVGYVEEDIGEIDGGGDGDGSEGGGSGDGGESGGGDAGGEGEGVPGSANAAAISIATLTMAIAANFIVQ